MIGAFYNLRSGQWLAGNLKILLIAWLVSELVVFSLAVKTVGLAGTLFLTFAASVLGVAILRRVGLSAAQHLRRTVQGGGAPGDAFVDGSLTALGAFLLIIPGFVSDAFGLALATPSIRQALMSRFVTPTRAPAPGRMAQRTRSVVIDLPPEDWRVVDRSERR